jgi:hypothetical protein
MSGMQRQGKVKEMSSDDPTKNLADDETKYDTKPGMTAVLERVNEVGERLSAEIAAVRTRVDEVYEFAEETRAEMGASFLLLSKKIDKLAGDILQVRAEQGLLEERMDKLEQKPA